MRFEDLDKKIKEAAEQYHPAYDEKAWLKMEKLLNEHLPQPKNDRRRIIFFLLLFILVGGGGFLLLSKPWNKNSDSSYQLAQDNKNKVQTKGNEKNDNSIIPTQPKADKTNKEIVTNLNSPVHQQSEETTAGETVAGKQFTNSPKNKIADQPQVRKDQVVKNNKSNIFLNNRNQDKNIATPENSKEIEPGIVKSSIQPNANAVEGKKEESKINNDITGEEKIKENINQEVAKTEVKKAPQKNDKPKNKNEFSLSVSAGPDVSKAGASKTGKTTLAYGAGVAYTRNRFTLRTGIYASKKIYWAGANDYKLRYTSTTTRKFEGADADCYVIEIPVKLSYNFGFKDKSNWFAGAGLSSYLMKRESYIYIFKTATGTTPYPYEEKNKNKHYFSVLNLSGGYTRQLSSTFSISAEPYIEIPLTGIGVGKTRLNSAGVLFTLGIKPFKK